MTTSVRLLWDMVDGPMPRGLLGVGSGDLTSTDTEHVLYLGGFSTTFRNRFYRATAPRGADLASAGWTVDVDARGRARPLVADPPRGAWDRGGMHTPSYLPAGDGTPARIYYAGRRGRRHVGAGSSYAIGVLEHSGGTWRRRSRPVLTGSGYRSSVLEPLVVRAGERHHLWYLATPHEVAPGEQPDYQLMSTSSEDGLTGWTAPEVFCTAAEGFFDNAVIRTGAGWLMVLARGTNLHGTTPYPEQGLWVMTASEPSVHRADWGAPRRLLDTGAPGTPRWMGRGVCDPTLGFSDDGRLTVVLTGTADAPPWPRLLVSRLLYRRRLPPPAPFYLATGSVTLDLP
ncbi:hypothetical protein [Cellulomonas xylanilytica]|uniref:Glycosyl hydrolase family 32 N-terminal domain-containing protein n=1 Tax=Cellulomonas xylanilytica TaxID=233583 RepID=A0A510VCM3_9CELL|nr:hypothetical protein [Cellulomonas xylanilytica]GEK22980.1 hypothetical protein CXY01_35000 [Cellulomonas xylanilytica]